MVQKVELSKAGNVFRMRVKKEKAVKIEDINSIACQIIADAGNSKSFSMEALSHAEKGAFEAVKADLEESEKALKKAHELHTQLLVKEAQDPAAFPVTLMLIHASNHLSNAEITRDFAERLIALYKNK